MSKSIPPEREMELQLARTLLKAIKTGVGIVDKTFYHNPDPAYYNKQATGVVVATMRSTIAMFEARYGSLDE